MRVPLSWLKRCPLKSCTCPPSGFHKTTLRYRLPFNTAVRLACLRDCSASGHRRTLFGPSPNPRRTLSGPSPMDPLRRTRAGNSPDPLRTLSEPSQNNSLGHVGRKNSLVYFVRLRRRKKARSSVVKMQEKGEEALGP